MTVERMDMQESDIERTRTEHYATARALVQSGGAVALSAWLQEKGMAWWLIDEAEQRTDDVLLSRAFTAINDWCECQHGRPSLLAQKTVAVGTNAARRQTARAFATA